MFTGIIESVGRLERATPTRHGKTLRVRTALGRELAPGQSVAVNGVCLTVTDRSDAWFEAVAVPETLSKTTLGQLAPDTPVNLERALRVGDRLDGHWVQGHVDGICRVAAVDGEGRYELTYPEAHAGHIIEHGSIAIDGISLTVARLSGTRLTVAIVPATFQRTNVGTWQVGTRCNVEFDLLAKYAARAILSA